MRLQPQTAPGVSRLARILDVAEQEFMMRGYMGASTNRIMARAGGSKATMAKYFKNKAGLFSAVINSRATALVQSINAKEHQGTPEEVLQTIGFDLLRYFMRPQGMMARRGMYAIGYRHPELSLAIATWGHAPIVNELTSLFTQWKARKIISHPDPAWAAHYFAVLLHGGMCEQILVGLRESASDQEIRAEVSQVCAFFLQRVAAPAVRRTRTSARR